MDVALPESVMVYVGSESCEWDDLMKTASLLHFVADNLVDRDLQHGKLFTDNCTASFYQIAAALNDIRDQTGVYQNKYVPFETLLAHSRDRKSTDPRDKFFAMLPLSNPDEVRIRPNYRKSVNTVYMMAALNLAATTLDFLTACQNPERENDLPSWVPDLSRALKTVRPPRPWCELSALTEKDIRTEKPKFLYESGTDILQVFGAIFDEIEIIKDVSNSTLGAEEKDGWFSFWKGHQERTKHFHMKEKDVLAYARYCMLNQDREG